MSVNIKFEPDGRSGIIAEGTYLWDAAKRLGIYLPAECEGHGTCDTCAVIVKEGATLLSSLTEAERERLSPERLASGERLACQTKVEHSGDLVLQPVPVTERAETSEETLKEFRKEFSEMPLNKKLATLVELEAVAMMQTLNAVFGMPFTAGEKVLNFMAGKGRAMNRRERTERRPVEHRAGEEPGTEEPVSDGG
jgi:ferredoxin